ncbi:uncharacterized protein N7473_013297 [Penicillium subrubescens]|uniref:uncharacterized protein n=1 Tax=Penicillium subrubescens TaxID=1316194 RepID=UPI0025455DF5|nr:uncharacterized protein N7473_013297 [Penicillium subrubescens]KAJ5873424.1 hypothetical protein N7473_013297 [Penicillium subrubescens]
MDDFNFRPGSLRKLRPRQSGQTTNESNSHRDAQPSGDLFHGFDSDDDSSPSLTQVLICRTVTMRIQDGPILELHFIRKENKWLKCPMSPRRPR